MITSRSTLVLAFLAAFSPARAFAGEVRLEVSLDKPTMLAGEKQSAFVKIALRGFKLEGKEKRAPVNVAIVLDKSGASEPLGSGLAKGDGRYSGAGFLPGASREPRRPSEAAQLEFLKALNERRAEETGDNGLATRIEQYERAFRMQADPSGAIARREMFAKAKDAAIAAIGRLESSDIVSIVAYDSTVEVIVPATRLSDKDAVIEQLRGIEARGATALFAGLSKGVDELRKHLDKNRVNRVILFSDGQADVGPQSPSELAALGASLRKEGISVSTFGLGLSYDEDLMTRLAQSSGGNHVFIEQAGDLAPAFNRELDDVLSVAAQQVAIEIGVADGVRLVRALNVDAEINGQEVIVQMNQLYGEQEKHVMLEVEVPATAAGESREVAEVRVSYTNMQTKTTDRLTGAVSARFAESPEEVEAKRNPAVSAAAALHIASAQNKLATKLRDEGDIEAAQKGLLENSRYLKEQASKYNAEILKKRSADNLNQASGIAGWWAPLRKAMRAQQLADDQQQSSANSKP